MPSDLSGTDWQELCDVLARMQTRANAAEAERDALRARLGTAEELLRESRQEHYQDSDGYYTCGAHPLAVNQAGEPCDCGADEWNAKITAFLSDGAP